MCMGECSAGTLKKQNQIVSAEGRTCELSRWRCDQPSILAGRRNHLGRVSQRPVEGVGERGGKTRTEKVDVHLQVPRRIEPVDHQLSTAAVGGAGKVQGEVS